MIKKIKYFFLAIIILLTPNFVFGAEKIFYMSEMNYKEGLESLKKNSEKIDILAPQFYGISPSLKFNGSLPLELKKVIKEKKIKVMPLLANYKFKQEIIHSILASDKIQEEIINQLIVIAKKENYIGWQFDFENINFSEKDKYSEFVEKTGKAMHKNGLVFSVAVVGRDTDYEETNFFKNWSGVYDYKRIAKAVDFVSLMAYDDPNSKGPVASLPYVKSVLKYAKDKISVEKLSLGIPLYNWEWDDSGKRIVSQGGYGGLLYVASKFFHNLGYDNNLGSSWLSYFWLGKEYKLWYQDKKDIKNKIDIIKKNNLKGFSAWVLGLEDPEIWNVVE